MSLFDMTGKVAVITGSTKGIGRAIAERMAEHGAKVVISSRKQDVCDSVSKEINDKFGKETSIAIATNISSKNESKSVNRGSRIGNNHQLLYGRSIVTVKPTGKRQRNSRDGSRANRKILGRPVKIPRHITFP